MDKNYREEMLAALRDALDAANVAIQELWGYEGGGNSAGSSADRALERFQYELYKLGYLDESED